MKQRILLVDDNEFIHTAFGSKLEEAGFEVKHADNGVEAINKAFLESPDLILPSKPIFI